MDSTILFIKRKGYPSIAHVFSYVFTDTEKKSVNCSLLLTVKPQQLKVCIYRAWIGTVCFCHMYFSTVSILKRKKAFFTSTIVYNQSCLKLDIGVELI